MNKPTEVHSDGNSPVVHTTVQNVLGVLAKTNHLMNAADALQVIAQVQGNILTAIYGNDEAKVKEFAAKVADMVPGYAAQWWAIKLKLEQKALAAARPAGAA